MNRRLPILALTVVGLSVSPPRIVAMSQVLQKPGTPVDIAHGWRVPPSGKYPPK
jgi:hypothetical protein